MRLWLCRGGLGFGLGYRRGVVEGIFWRFIRIILSCQSWDRLGVMGWRMRGIFRPPSRVLRMIRVSGRLLQSSTDSCIWQNKDIPRLMLLLGMEYGPLLGRQADGSYIILTSMISGSLTSLDRLRLITLYLPTSHDKLIIGSQYLYRLD